MSTFVKSGGSIGEKAKIDSISVNGVTQSIDENKNVDIAVPKMHVNSIEIPISGWEEYSSGLYRLSIPEYVVDANSIVSINLDLASLEVAANCGLKAVTESYNGGFYIYADSSPAAALTGTMVIQKGA